MTGALIPSSLCTSASAWSLQSTRGGGVSWSRLYPQDLGQGLAYNQGSHKSLLTAGLIHARAMLDGFDPQSAHESRGGGGGVTPYRARSSVHSISGPALMGLVHFCCTGLSSSATQHSSPVPGRSQKLDDAQIKDLKPPRNKRSHTLGRRAGSSCTQSLGSPPAASGSHLPTRFPGEMLEAAVGITG